MAKRVVALVMACLFAATAIVGVTSDASAEGDKVRHTHGEDQGYYDEKNNNPFPDDVFPGEATKNRTWETD